MREESSLKQKRIVLYEQAQDGKFDCCLEEWNGKDFVPIMSERHDKAIFAFIDLKRNAILEEKWVEYEEENHMTKCGHKPVKL